MNFKERYKEDINSLSFSSDYEARLYDAMINAEKKSNTRVTVRRKSLMLIAAVLTVMLLLSVCTVAEPTRHTPDATTVDFQSSVTDFEDRWKKSRKFPYEKGDENYAFTVLGIASGSFLNGCDGFSADTDTKYFITAIRSHSGEKLTLKEGFSHFKITPLIYGREPWETNSSTLCTDVRVTEKSGVIYYLFDTDFIDSFNGRVICFAVYEGESDLTDIFTMDENGIIFFSEDYKGFGQIIELPQDLTDTHHETAEDMLSEDILSKLS